MADADKRALAMTKTVGTSGTTGFPAGSRRSSVEIFRAANATRPQRLFWGLVAFTDHARTQPLPKGVRRYSDRPLDAAGDFLTATRCGESIDYETNLFWRRGYQDKPARKKGSPRWAGGHSQGGATFSRQVPLIRRATTSPKIAPHMLTKAV